MPYCPTCKYEYTSEVKKCPSCDVDLVAELPKTEDTYSDEEMVCIFSANDEMEAKIVRGDLEAAGIAVWERSELVQTVQVITVGPLAEQDLYVLKSREDDAKKTIEDALAAGKLMPSGEE